MMCDENGIWNQITDSSDIPPGSCANIGARRRIDGLCYV